jgi:hypothetical protein
VRRKPHRFQDLASLDAHGIDNDVIASFGG